MRARFPILIVFLSLVSALAPAQSATSLAPDVRPYVKVEAPVIALTHVKVIDGTGAPARADQTIVISEGKIQAVGDAAGVSVPPNAKVLDRPGYSVIPGLVMMHEHLFYAAGLARNPDGSVAQPIMIKEVGFSFPRLYLAAGVTSLRTAGSLEP
jgi:cytosine/adenosine deaminase-related metal-dependent hydrolase